MYHLLKGHHRPRFYQVVYYPFSEKQGSPSVPEPGAAEKREQDATDRESPAQPGATQECEPMYTIIGEPVFPAAEIEAITIVLDPHPAPSDHQQNEEMSGPEEEQGSVPPTPHHSRFAPFGWMLAGVALVLAGVLVVTLVIPWWQTSATVTIVLMTQPVSTTFTAQLVAGNADPAHRQVQGRQLAALTMSQSKTVATTGSGSQRAQAAQGWVILYNALSAPQTIVAGTHIIGQDDVQVTTDITVTVPAGNAPTEGSVSVSAHASQPGPAGNIAALDIDGPCCRSDVLARNTVPFTGGQNARSFQAVSAQDIQGASSALETSLMQDVTAAYHAELQDGESLLTPVACRSQVQANHPAGSEAEQVTVSVSEACQGIAYNTVQMQALVTQVMNQQTHASQAGSYQLDSRSLHLQATPSGTLPGEVDVQARGMLLYQWNEQQHTLAALIASKNEAQATALLLQQPGISTVAISLQGRDTGMLPDDPNSIHFTVVAYEQEGAITLMRTKKQTRLVWQAQSAKMPFLTNFRGSIDTRGKGAMF